MVQRWRDLLNSLNIGIGRKRVYSLFQSIKLFLPPIVLIVIFVSTSIKGVDFGFHWDEARALRAVEGFLKSERLLPGWYRWPPMFSYIALAGLIPYAIPMVMNPELSWPMVKTILINEVIYDTPTYLLNVRMIFIYISAISILWIYLGQLGWKRDWREATLSAALLGLSWEAAYHSRFVAPDAIMMQFGALILMIVILIMRWPHLSGFLYRAAALFVGFAGGLKYPGIFLILPVYMVAIVNWRRKRYTRKLLPTIIAITGWFVLGFLLIVPGAVLEPIRFFEAIFSQIEHYGTGHRGYTVTAGWNHLWLMLNYLGRVLFSPYQWIAIFFALLVPIGAYHLYNENRDKFFILAIFPVTYLIFFMSQSVMFVRNILVLAPFLTIFSARGAAYVYKLMKPFFARATLALLIILFLGLNTYWLFFAAETIKDRHTNRFAQELTSYIEETPDQTFYLSESIWNALDVFAKRSMLNITRSVSVEVDIVVVSFLELSQNTRTIYANQAFAFPEGFGPLDINLDYYPSWEGSDRFIYMPLVQAIEMGIVAMEN